MSATRGASGAFPPRAFPGEGAPPTRSGIAGWILYDLANTIFSLAVVSFYFPLWVIASGGTDGLIGLATGTSMLLVALTAPLLGTISDALPRRMPFLVATTGACVALTLLLGRTPLALGLVLFGLANVAYQLGLVFYDALLPDVSTPATRGRIGGLGVAVGYVGSFIGLGVGALLLARPTPPGWLPAPFTGLFTGDAYPDIFLATGLLFLAFAVPCFLLVRERSRPLRRVDARPTALVRSVARTVADTRHHPGLARFLVGRFFFADAANTLIAFMGVYVVHEVGFTEGGAQGVLAVGITGAIVGGALGGWLADRVGPKRALFTALFAWLVTFTLTIAVPVAGLPQATFWGVAALAGASLGATWAADRPFMLRLTPPARVGEFYGLYALAGRFAAVTGPLLWGLVVTVLDLGRPAAVGVLGAMVILSMVILARVGDTPAADAGRHGSA